MGIQGRPAVTREIGSAAVLYQPESGEGLEDQLFKFVRTLEIRDGFAVIGHIFAPLYPAVSVLAVMRQSARDRGLFVEQKNQPGFALGALVFQLGIGNIWLVAHRRTVAEAVYSHLHVALRDLLPAIGGRLLFPSREVLHVRNRQLRPGYGFFGGLDKTGARLGMFPQFAGVA